MFKNLICETNTNHEKGFIFRSEASSGWLLICFKTPFYYIADGKYGSGNSGEMILHPPGANIEHSHINEKMSFINDWIYFESDDNWLRANDIRINEAVPCSNTKLFTKLIDTINYEEIKNDRYSRDIISNTIHTLVLNYSRDADAMNEIRQIPENLEETRNTILSNIQNKWSLNTMSKMSGYSISRFCNLYTQYYNTSPINELIDARIDKSKYLLKLRSYSITEISEMCGFSSIHYFSKCFKSKCGCSPREYIEGSRR